MIVGVLGGGQLARMLAEAGRRLGLEFLFLSPDADACAAAFGEHLRAEYTDEAALAHLATRADVVTYEFENVPAASVAFLESHVAVHPSAAALAVGRDRLNEKTRFRALGIPTAEFDAVTNLSELEAAVARIGLPAILKTRTHGYDGKGQAVLRAVDDLPSAWERIGGHPCLVEAMVPFDREVSVIAVRGTSGETAFYPVSENVHRAGMLRLSLSRPGDPAQAEAEALAVRLLDDLGYVGVLAMELFQVESALLANEIAPRVHNSGHWSIEGARTSQFENHLRAILGRPLGPTALTRPAAMVNVVGDMPQDLEARLPPGCRLHVYGKVPRPGRKLAHVTVLADADPTFAARTVTCLRLAGEDEIAEKVESGAFAVPNTPLRA